MANNELNLIIDFQNVKLVKEKIDALAAENERLLSALISMCEQYIQQKDGTLFHMFMHAGEEATEVLEDMGYLTCDNRENYSWTDKRAALSDKEVK